MTTKGGIRRKTGTLGILKIARAAARRRTIYQGCQGQPYKATRPCIARDRGHAANGTLRGNTMGRALAGRASPSQIPGAW